MVVAELEPLGSSPHTRGAPRPHDAFHILEADHPRIRGEHVGFLFRIAVGYGSSPHTRGALRRPGRPAPPARIIPAYAGSTLRGFLEVPGYGGSSPHTRGAQSSCGVFHIFRRIIPAYAGSTARRRSPAVPPTDHPRIRGEHQCAGIQLGERSGSSPHTRGAPHPSAPSQIHERIIPAYAGSTTSGATKARSTPDHPRIRGEHAALDVEGLAALGSSPHTRGARR